MRFCNFSGNIVGHILLPQLPMRENTGQIILCIVSLVYFTSGERLTFFVFPIHPPKVPIHNKSKSWLREY